MPEAKDKMVYRIWKLIKMAVEWYLLPYTDRGLGLRGVEQTTQLPELSPSMSHTIPPPASWGSWFPLPK